MNNLLNSSKKFIKRNSSTILTCIGAIGVAATAIISAKDTVKAVKLIEAKKHENPDAKLSKKEIIKTAAPAYIPTAAISLSTIACVFGANALNKKSQASLMSAYALLDRSYKDYRNQAKEIYGEDSDKRIKESVANLYYEDNGVYKPENGKELFFDFYGLQFFESTLKEVENAENAMNQMLESKGYVGLNLFYDMLGIECIEEDYEVGWSLNTCQQQGFTGLDFTNEKIVQEDGSSFYVIDMPCSPVNDYMF